MFLKLLKRKSQTARATKAQEWGASACRIVMGFLGCARYVHTVWMRPVRTTDNLVAGTPRGYVLFTLNESSFSGWLYKGEVSEIAYKGTQYVGDIGGGFYNRWARKVAAVPGYHKYQLTLGSAERDIEVDVVQDMIIPVLEITLTPYGSTSGHAVGGSFSSLKFGLSVKVGPTQPIKTQQAEKSN